MSQPHKVDFEPESNLISFKIDALSDKLDKMSVQGKESIDRLTKVEADIEILKNENKRKRSTSRGRQRQKRRHYDSRSRSRSRSKSGIRLTSKVASDILHFMKETNKRNSSKSYRPKKDTYQSRSRSKTPDGKKTLFCKFCKTKGHNIYKCFKLLNMLAKVKELKQEDPSLGDIFDIKWAQFESDSEEEQSN